MHILGANYLLIIAQAFEKISFWTYFVSSQI